MPASCTAELQPQNLSFIFVFKSGVAILFASWLSQVAQELLKGVSPDKLKFDLTLQNVKIPFVKWVYKTLKKISDIKQSAMIDGWRRSSGISISWATKDDELEERDTLYEEARALDRQKALFIAKGERSKDAAVEGLLEQSIT